MFQENRDLRGAGEVSAYDVFTVVVCRLFVGMLIHAAVSTNMPAHVTNVWKKATTMHIW